MTTETKDHTLSGSCSDRGKDIGNVCAEASTKTNGEDQREIKDTGSVVDVQRAVAETGSLGHSSKTCLVCCLGVSETNLMQESVTERCEMRSLVCKQCLMSHIHEEIVSRNRHTRVRCICSPGCSVLLEYSEVRRYAKTEDFDIYDEALFRESLNSSANPEFRWCSRPGCGFGQMHQSREEFPKMTCQSCGFQTCFTHRCPWHEGKTCAQFENTEVDDFLESSLHKAGVRKCPKCGMGIQKIDGCDHITCGTSGGCGEDFCWSCLAPYNGDGGIRLIGNSAHKPHCPHFR